MEKIKKLRQLFKKEEIDGYLIFKNDEFFSEYLPQHNDRLNFISNFSGSFGFSLILKNKNYLFVDGRYTLQANYQSSKKFKILTIPENMPFEILKNKKLFIGFDPKLITKKTLNIFFKNCNCEFKPLNKNLVDEIWKRKIITKNSKFYILPKNSVDYNYKFKVKKIVSNLKRKGADFQFITSSENNAWLFNIRGSDVKYSPIPHCYVLINKNGNINFFCNLKKINPSLEKSFNKVKFKNIGSITKILADINNKNFIIDENTCSFYFERKIAEKNKILNFGDPIYNLKAIKSKREIENVKTAHIYDGVALTKYLFWIKKNYSRKKITEMSAAKKLFKFRKKNSNFMFPSFPTISGTGPNAAIIHYKVSKKSNLKLKKGDLYLVDSGGQYKFGTTDVTRTISLNNSNKRIKNIFTRVLKGHIAVANFNLKTNTSGSEIDVKARKYLKQIGLDYKHGTGHGVGYFLNVHEGPQAISKKNKIKFQEGMIVSNEPGYYETNKFGIRIENLIYVRKQKNKKKFENLTMVPIDKELININLLDKNEKIWLNQYHKKVFFSLKGSMNSIEMKELKRACSAI